MLGAVLPEMRVQAEALAADLADLVRIRKEIADEKDRLLRDVAALTEERQRIEPADRGAAEEADRDREGAREPSGSKSLALARQVDNLKDLIGKVEQGLDSASRAARAAARAAESQGQPNRSGGPQRSRPADAGGRICLGPRPIAASG